MADRRIFARIAGSAFPSLSALTARSTNVAVIDISDGGLLIETPVRVTPGEREMVVLDANATIKKAGWIERVELIRLIPSLSYRTAIRFFAPIDVLALTRSQPPVLRRASRETIGRFARWARELSGVHAVRVSSSLPFAPWNRTGSLRGAHVALRRRPAVAGVLHGGRHADGRAVWPVAAHGIARVGTAGSRYRVELHRMGVRRSLSSADARRVASAEGDCRRFIQRRRTGCRTIAV